MIHWTMLILNILSYPEMLVNNIAVLGYLQTERSRSTMLSKADKDLIHRDPHRIELKPLNLPPDFEEKDNCTYYRGEKISNFTLKIVFLFNLINPPNQEDELYCLLQYNTGNAPPDEPDESRMFKVDVSKLDSPAYLKKTLPKQCLSKLDYKAMSKYLRDAIISTLLDMKPVDVVHPQPGHNYYKRIPYFCYGDTTECADQSIEFYNDCEHKLKDHSKYTEGFSWLLKYMKCPWTTPIELLVDLATKVQYLFNDTDRRFALWIYGKTAIGKSVSANLIFDDFIDHGNCRKLSSDKDSINKADIPGSTLLIEDFSKNESHRISEANLEKAEDMVGRFQSTAPTIRKGTRCDLSGNLALTAEVKPKNKSTANRCVFLKMIVKFVSNELTELQDDSPQLITLKLDFIRFNLLHEKEIISNMKGYLESCEPEADDYKDIYVTNARVQRNKQTLKVTLLLFMQFLKNSNFFLYDDLKKIEKRFNDSIEQCICETYDVLKAYILKDGESKYVKELASMLWLPQEIRLTNSFSIFSQHTKAFTETGEGQYIFFYDEKETQACVHSDALLQLFYDEKLGLTSEQFRKKLFSDFKKADVIDFRGKDSTYPIKDHDRRKRYIHLRLDKLRSIYLDEIEKLDCDMGLSDRDLQYVTQNDIDEEIKALRQEFEEDQSYENWDDCDDYDFP